MIFVNMDLDSKYQTNEKVRLDFSKTLVTVDNDPITLVEVQPDGGDWIAIANPAKQSGWVLDWQYTIAQSVDINIKFNGVQVTPSKTIEIVTPETDMLYSTDADLFALEPDITKWLPTGRSTWSYVHRKAQDKIIFELNKSRIYNMDGTPLLKSQILDKDEVKEWSVYLVLSLIFKGISNQVDDVFEAKAKYYESKAKEAKEYCFNVLRVDANKDAVTDVNEVYSFRSSVMVR